MDPIIGASLIGAGSDLIGGLFGGGKLSPRKQMAMQYEYQRNLNQTAIQDRVADAEKAGIHPLYALGASLNPGGVSMPDQSAPTLGDRLSGMGQNISRSMMARQSKEERVMAVEMAREDLRGKKLQNDILNSQAINARTQLPPGVPNQGGINPVDKDIIGQGKYGEEVGKEAGTKWVDLPGIGPVRFKGKALEEATEDNHLANLAFDLSYTVPDYLRSGFNSIRSAPPDWLKTLYKRTKNSPIGWYHDFVQRQLRKQRGY